MSTLRPEFQKYAIFSLKDFEKTKSKVSTYSPRGNDYSQLSEEVISILDYGVDIFTICSATNREIFLRYIIQQSRIETPKALAKLCHTAVNNLAFQYHIEQFKALDLTPSQAIQCSKRFYIENYDAINTKLAELLEETLTQTPLASSYFID